MSRRTRLLLWSFTLLGLIASSESAWVHHGLLTRAGFTSFCDINDTFSCASAYLSPYGSLFGVPVAVFGVAWFVAVAALLLAARPGTATSENTPGYLLVMSTVGLGVILYLAWGAFVVLKTVCLLCLATYVAVIGIFLVSGSATAFPMSTIPARAWRDLRSALSSPVAVTAIVLLVAGVASAVAFFPREPQRSASPLPGLVAPAAAPAASPASTAEAPQAAQSSAAAPASGATTLSSQEQAQLEQWLSQQSRSIVPVDGGGAPVVIVKFNDYQCPPCRQTNTDFKPILQKYAAQAPGKVKFLTKHFPLDPECNAATPNGPHQAACEAAAAVVLAKDKGEILEGWLFANQATLTPMGVRVAARDVGGVQDFDGQYARALDQVRADIALGRLLNVQATPTFFVNGIPVRGGMPPHYFDALIALELKRAGK
jgi:protein-disulfide isomerase